MGKKIEGRTHLRLIPGGLCCQTALKQTDFDHLKRLWLITSSKITFEIIDMLQAELQA